MSNLKLLLRKGTNAALGLLPSPLVRYVLKSYYYNPSLRNRIRYHIEPLQYWSAVPDVSELDMQQLNRSRALPGVLPDLAVFDDLIDKLKPYAAQLPAFPKEPDNSAPFSFHNGGYEDLDAVTLYAMVRHLKPRRMIEVGCGYSSRMTTMACVKNAAEGVKTECLFVEPFPAPHLLNFQLSGPLLAKKIQDVPLDHFTKLESGDILFIDTTHVLKAQSDVCYIFFSLLPALAKGVYIHFHDIFTPFDYPAEWILKHGIYYNEQYVLEAVLCNSSQFETILPVHALWQERRNKLLELFPAAETRPGAYWIRKRV